MAGEKKKGVSFLLHLILLALVLHYSETSCMNRTKCIRSPRDESGVCLSGLRRICVLVRRPELRRSSDGTVVSACEEEETRGKHLARNRNSNGVDPAAKRSRKVKVIDGRGSRKAEGRGLTHQSQSRRPAAQRPSGRKKSVAVM